MADNRKKWKLKAAFILDFVQAGKYIFFHIATFNFNPGINRSYSKISAIRVK